MNKTMTLRIDQETYELLEKLKKEKKLPKSAIIRTAVIEFNNKRK